MDGRRWGESIWTSHNAGESDSVWTRRMDTLYSYAVRNLAHSPHQGNCGFREMGRHRQWEARALLVLAGRRSGQRSHLAARAWGSAQGFEKRKAEFQEEKLGMVGNAMDQVGSDWWSFGCCRNDEMLHVPWGCKGGLSVP